MELTGKQKCAISIKRRKKYQEAFRKSQLSQVYCEVKRLEDCLNIHFDIETFYNKIKNPTKITIEIW